MPLPLAEGMKLLSDDEISTRLDGLANWDLVEGAKHPSIAATYTFTDFAGAMDFVNRVAGAAEQMNHHPDIDIRWNKVTLTLSTHSEGGLTTNDFELARRIDTESGQDG